MDRTDEFETSMAEFGTEQQINFYVKRASLLNDPEPKKVYKLEKHKEKRSFKLPLNFDPKKKMKDIRSKIYKS